jgi:hypothetical protein
MKLVIKESAANDSVMCEKLRMARLFIVRALPWYWLR